MAFSKHTEFLDPGRRLPDAVAKWLCSRAADDCGAKSLSRFLLVVPTAQSGRTLRRRLAETAARNGWGGIIPPRIIPPSALAVPREAALPRASDIATRAAFVSFVRSGALSGHPSLFAKEASQDVQSVFSLFSQLQDIWRALAAAGMTMSDVHESAMAAEYFQSLGVGGEEERWAELASFEAEFFKWMSDSGAMHNSQYVKAALADPEILDGEIEEIVLPQLADPVPFLYPLIEKQGRKTAVLVHAEPGDAGKFDDWGRPLASRWGKEPVAGIGRVAVSRFTGDRELGEAVAADFPPVDSGFEMPALGLADRVVYPDLCAAFLNRKPPATLHNPAMHRLRDSSLGRTVADLARVHSSAGEGFEWDAFSRLLRSGDVLSRLGMSSPDFRSAVLEGMDICQNAFFPSACPENADFPAGSIHNRDRKAFDAFRTAAKCLADVLSGMRRESLPAFIRKCTEWIFSGKDAGDSPEGRELSAAAACLAQVLEELESPLARKCQAQDLLPLCLNAFHESSYSLEAEADGTITTMGWLELQWCDADKIAIAGFHEGAVPDSVTGHAFLPDGLREALGITSNRQRFARDAFLFSEMIASRSEPGAIRAYLSHAGRDGTVRKPGRLLFLVDDASLPDRTQELYGDLETDDSHPPRRVCADFRMNLPDEVPFPSVFSASAIDTYLSSPFAYLLKYPLGMADMYKEKNALDYNDFGSLVHKVLESYASEQLRRGGSQPSREEEIRKELYGILDEVESGFDSNPGLEIKLQLDALRQRLGRFAAVQAQWARDGWRVAEKPELRFEAKPFEGDLADVRIKGFVDRIDCRGSGDSTEYRIIDYKTWDDPGYKHVRAGVSKPGPDKTLAETLHLPVYRSRGKDLRLLSVQLPLYAECLEAADPARFRGRITELCYLVLGDEETRALPLKDERTVAADTVRKVLRLIRGNVFWPEGRTSALRYDIGRILLNSPAMDLTPAEGDADFGRSWVDGQKARIARLREEGTV